MMRFLQRLGKALMLPVACLPICGVLMGIGYWIDPAGLGSDNLIVLLLIKAGSILIENMAVLFAVGVAIGMSKDQEGTAALAAIISWLTVQSMLSGDMVQLVLGVEADAVPAAFDKIDSQFIGIVCGLIAAFCYNMFYKVNMPSFLAVFAGRRFVPIVTVLASLVACCILYFIWPAVYSFLVGLGQVILRLGAVGAGLYGFLNRLLIPVGMHHALNSVFWFDVANIYDIGKFWGTIEGGVLGQTGMYQAGFFPVMMFGLPGAALAMYHTAKPAKKKRVGAILLSAALCAFFTGVTEPMEFSFMFLAPGLYFVHAVLTGISVGLVAALPIRSGFQFSAGFVDWLLSFKVPFAMKPLLLIPIGLVFFVVYYMVFRLLIVKLNLKTYGREDEHNTAKMDIQPGGDNSVEMAKAILAGVGGAENVVSMGNCITRLRLEVKDRLLVDEKKLKESGAAGVIRPSRTSVQVVIGPKVQFVADEFKKLLQQSQT